nr:hypothetical protein [Clostridia bacterium]
MARITKSKAAPTRIKKREGMAAPDKAMLMFTVVNRSKADFYADIIQGFEVNMQLILHAQGTAGTEVLSLLGLNDSDRAVIISVIRRDRADEAMSTLEEKFRTVKGGKGIAYTVPMTSTIGVAIYQFLCNKTPGGIG